LTLKAHVVQGYYQKALGVFQNGWVGRCEACIAVNARSAKEKGASIRTKPVRKCLNVEALCWAGANCWILDDSFRNRPMPRSLVNAAGPWVTNLFLMTQLEIESPPKKIRLIKGSHINRS